MKTRRLLRSLWLLPIMGGLMLAAQPAAAETAAPLGAEVATMAIQGGGVSFAPRLGMRPMTLRVQGGEFMSTESFRPGQAAWFAPVDRKGYQLPDGTYNWEITETAERPRPARGLSSNDEAPADGRSARMVASAAGRVQSGHFTIENGVIVDSNLIEARTPRSAEVSIDLNDRIATDEFAERAARMDDGVVPSRPSSRAPQRTEPPSAAARAAEHRDQDGN